jgi:hypothetical protein
MTLKSAFLILSSLLFFGLYHYTGNAEGTRHFVHVVRGVVEFTSHSGEKLQCSIPANAIALIVNKEHPMVSISVAEHQIYQTRNLGRAWKITLPISGMIKNVEMSVSTDNVLVLKILVLSGDGDSREEIWRSTDAGEHWLQSRFKSIQTALNTDVTQPQAAKGEGAWTLYQLVAE